MITHAEIIASAKAKIIYRAVEDLKDIQDGYGTMVNHEEADLILCRVLSGLGAKEVVDEWKLVKKWYA